MSINQSIGQSEHHMSQPLSPIEANPRGRQEEVIDLLQYWRIIMLHKWRIAILAITITLLVAVYAMSLTPIYRSTATLMIESQQAKVLSIEEIYGLNSGNKEYLITQFEILKSRGIAERAVDALNLMQESEFLLQESADPSFSI